MPSKTNRTLTNPEEIREWAEERGAKPACVMGTGSGDDAGMIRLDFPGYSGEGRLQEITWEEWFQKFEANNLALIVQDKTAGGERSNFNKLVSRESASQGHSGKSGSTSRGGRGGSRAGGAGSSKTGRTSR